MKVAKWCLYCSKAGRCKIVTPEKVMEGFYCRNFTAAEENVLDGREIVVRELGAGLTAVAVSAPRH